MIKDITQNVIVDFKKKGDEEAKRAVKDLSTTVDGLKAKVKDTTASPRPVSMRMPRRARKPRNRSAN